MGKTPQEVAETIARNLENPGGSRKHYKPNSSVRSYSGCFSGETLIATQLGLRPISSIGQGDLVFSASSDGFRLNRVIQVKRHRPERIWVLALRNGGRIRTTTHHSFKTPNGWRKSNQIRVGDKLYVRSPDGTMSLVDVATSNHVSDVEEVFNLVVERDFNFFAGGVVAHSFTAFRLVRCALYTLYLMLHERGQEPSPYRRLSANNRNH